MFVLGTIDQFAFHLSLLDDELARARRLDQGDQFGERRQRRHGIVVEGQSTVEVELSRQVGIMFKNGRHEIQPFLFAVPITIDEQHGMALAFHALATDADPILTERLSEQCTDHPCLFLITVDLQTTCFRMAAKQPPTVDLPEETYSVPSPTERSERIRIEARSRAEESTWRARRSVAGAVRRRVWSTS